MKVNLIKSSFPQSSQNAFASHMLPCTRGKRMYRTWYLHRSIYTNNISIKITYHAEINTRGCWCCVNTQSSDPVLHWALSRPLHVWRLLYVHGTDVRAAAPRVLQQHNNIWSHPIIFLHELGLDKWGCWLLEVEMKRILRSVVGTSRKLKNQCVRARDECDTNYSPVHGPVHQATPLWQLTPEVWCNTSYSLIPGPVCQATPV